jgi:hypothetical protein
MAQDIRVSWKAHRTRRFYYLHLVRNSKLARNFRSVFPLNLFQGILFLFGLRMFKPSIRCQLFFLADLVSS